MGIFARVAVARFRHFAKPFSPFPCKMAQVRTMPKGVGWGLPLFFIYFEPYRLFKFLDCISSLALFTITPSRHAASIFSYCIFSSSPVT